MWDILERTVHLKKFREERFDQDNVDRFFSIMIPTLFTILGVLCTLQQYVGKPMSCLFPATVPSTYYRYFQINCLLSKTYFWPESTSLNDAEVSRHGINYITYYPFLFVMFLISASLFIVPNTFWRIISNNSGFGISRIIATIRSCQMALISSQNYQVYNAISSNLISHSNLHRKRSAFKRYYWYKDPCTSLQSNYLITGYLVHKFMYILIIILTVFSWNSLLDKKFWKLGVDFLFRIFSNQKYAPSHLFPHYSLCDVNIYGMKITKYTFECYMTRNVFLDFIITFLWYVLLIIFLAALYNSFSSLWFFYSSKQRTKKILKWMKFNFIEVEDHVDRNFQCINCGMISDLRKIEPCNDCKLFIETRTFTKRKLEIFVNETLNNDILLCLWFISIKTIFGNFNAANVLHGIWTRRNLAYNDYESRVVAKRHPSQFYPTSDSSSQNNNASDQKQFDEVI